MAVRSGPTIYDVAAAAGVAPSTVSRALSNPGRVSYETAERIREVAQRLGYRSASMQREMQRVKGLLALAVADISNPVFAPIIRGAQQRATEGGFSVMLLDTQGSPEVEEELLAKVAHTIDGVLLTSSRMSDLTIRRIAKTLPLVTLNRVVTQVPAVISDNVRAIKRASEHLGALGHREICFLAGPDHSWEDGVRWQALREASLELGFRARRIMTATPTRSGGAAAYPVWKSDPTSAVIAYNDLIAIGFMEAARADGRRVPEAVSVVGFDNIADAAEIRPGLTTIAPALVALGAAGLTRLISSKKPGELTEPARLPARLVVRQSTAQMHPTPLG